MRFRVPQFRNSLKNRIMLLVSLVVLGGIWGLAVPLVSLLQHDLEKSITDKLQTMVRYASSHIDQEMRLRFDAMADIADNLAAESDGGHGSMQHHLQHSHFLPAIFPGGMFVLDPTGKVIADVPLNRARLGGNLAEADYFRAVMATQALALGAPVREVERRGGASVMIAVPIRDNHGGVAGVLAAPAYLQDEDLLGVLEETRLGETGDFVVLSEKDRVVLGASDPQRILDPLPAAELDAAFRETALTRDADGTPVLQVGSRIATTGWTILAGIPTKEAFAPVSALKRQVYLGALAMTVLIAILLHFVLRRQLMPLVEAGEALRKMREAHAPLAPIPVLCDDEVGHLAYNFNRLVSDRNALDASLRESEKRFRDIVNSTDGIVWEADAETGRFTFVSDQAERLLGYPADAWKEPGFWCGLLHPDDRAIVAGLCADRPDAAAPSSFECRVIAADGTILWLHALVTIVSENGRPRWRRGIMLDMTDRKRAERELKAAKAEAERANNAKSRFLAAASHDLRQPLSALSLYVGVLDSKLMPGHTGLAANIKTCVDSLSEMLNDLLDLSKLEAGAVTPEMADFSLSKLLTSIVATHAPQARAKGLVLRCAHCELTARTDPVLLSRIIGNFVANAIRYTDAGGVLVGCRRHEGRTWVEVWDTGIGIPADKTGEIFEEFRQLDNNARDRSKGSGLGLAIVAKTAGLLGLEIRVQSRPGRGSLFAIEVPLGEASFAPVVCEPTFRALRIALVDDDERVAQALSYALREVGHEVLVAATGAQLLADLGLTPPDVVISDYRLGGGETGFDVIDAVRAVFGADQPALLITGDTDPQLIRDMKGRGIRVVHKPVEFTALRQCIGEVCRTPSAGTSEAPRPEPCGLERTEA